MTQEELIQETLEQDMQLLLQLAVMYTNRNDRTLGTTLSIAPEDIRAYRHGQNVRPVHYSEVFIMNTLAQEIGRQPDIVSKLRQTADFLEHQQNVLKEQEALYRKHREALDAKK